MTNKYSKIKGIFALDCPRCGEGKLFKTKNPFAFGKITEMHENCSSCNLKYDREPGFFYGAMYISYAINIAFFVVFLVLYFNFFRSHKILHFFFVYVGFMLLIFPINFRIARSAWIHMVTTFEGK